MKEATPPPETPARAFRGAGFMCYGPDIRQLYRRAAELADMILRGGKPAEIPVEQPTRFNLIVNLKAAKALGLAIHLTLLAFAHEVIERIIPRSALFRRVAMRGVRSFSDAKRKAAAGHPDFRN
jgi:hypothetical protein